MGVAFFTVRTRRKKKIPIMENVRYTKLLTHCCFRALTFFAESITTIDDSKSQRQFEEEIDILIDHLHTIKRLSILTQEASAQSEISLNVINLN
jgi:hypothetical protein